jgi:ATP-dependent DNA helicase RecG
MPQAPNQPNASAPGLNTDLLRKVLTLEKSKGYSNKAVAGGLDEFLKRWAAEAHKKIADPELHRTLARLELTAPAYAQKAIPAREAWIAAVLQWCDAASGGKAAPAPPPRQAAPSPPSRPAPQAAPRPPPLPQGPSLADPITSLRGFGPAIAEKLEALGVRTIRDLLYFFPRKHIDFSQKTSIPSLQAGKDQTIIGVVLEAKEVRYGQRRLGAAEAVVGDDSGSVRVIWFNQPYIARNLKQGMRIALSGRVVFYQGRKVLENPEYEVADEGELVHTGRLVPVYALTEGLSGRRLRSLMKQVTDHFARLVPDSLSPAQRQHLQLAPVDTSIRQAHFPESETAKESARRRLAFDELLLIQLGVLARKREWKETMPGHPLKANTELLAAFYSLLPFKLTGAQQRAIAETLEDMSKSTPMSRLLQGEVGSGKTVVAVSAILTAVANGQQVAFMAPTEILAEQHFRTVQKLLGPMLAGEPSKEVARFALPQLRRPLTIGLLTGSTTRKRKQELQQMTATGEIDVLTGTHSLFQKDVQFSSLGLVVVDEQHRFGVMQRMELRQKGYNPHLLVMTATPIPRTLSLTLYGDLDISVLNELPPGRQVIRTRYLEAGRRDTAYEFIRRQVAEGRQAFIVYPLIEESEKMEAAAAVKEHERLSREVFPDLRVALLHGRIKGSEKDSIMRRFQAREFDILVSTAVIEVGIDIPNATVMMVESADRFGLAQLHQFRGRVGRGQHQSYCILMSDSPTPEASERLRLMEALQDGFALAEEDLKLRGPGDFFGTRQSGLPDLRMARLSDAALLTLARQEAEAIFHDDPTLAQPEHRVLASEVARVWAHREAAPGEA